MHIQWYLDTLKDQLAEIERSVSNAYYLFDQATQTIADLQEQIQTLETETVKGAS